jgi:hypothetical protein
MMQSRNKFIQTAELGDNFPASLFQIPLRPTQQVEFDFEFADDHLESVQLDALKRFHPLFQAKLEPLQNLNRRQLRLNPDHEQSLTSSPYIRPREFSLDACVA